MGTTSQIIPQPAESLQVGQPFNPHRVFRFLTIPESVAASRALTPSAKLAYGHLCRRAGEDGRCWPSRKDVGLHVGLSERQVVRTIRELEAFGLIRTVSRLDNNGRTRSNEYEFLWHLCFSQGTGGEGVTHDRGEGVTHDRGRVSSTTPPRVSRVTPLEENRLRSSSEEEKKKSPSVPDFSTPAKREPPAAEGKALSDKAPEVSSHHPASSEPLGIEFAFASPLDELKSVLSEATGEAVPAHDLQTILQTLELRQVPLEEFVRKTKPHLLRKSTTNPIGLAKTFANKFGRLTAPAVEPAPAAYVCPTCKSTKPGEGCHFVDGQIVPCHCATPEYIAAKRHIFAAHTAIGATSPQHAVA